MMKVDVSEPSALPFLEMEDERLRFSFSPHQ